MFLPVMIFYRLNVEFSALDDSIQVFTSKVLHVFDISMVTYISD